MGSCEARPAGHSWPPPKTPRIKGKHTPVSTLPGNAASRPRPREARPGLPGPAQGVRVARGSDPQGPGHHSSAGGRWSAWHGARATPISDTWSCETRGVGRASDAVPSAPRPLQPPSSFSKRQTTFATATCPAGAGHGAGPAPLHAPVALPRPDPPPRQAPALAGASAPGERAGCGYVRLLGSLACWLSGMISMRCCPYR